MVAEAGDLGLVQMMIERGANVNLMTNSDTATALMQAASGGNLQIVKLLVEAGANANEVKGGDFALMGAIQGGQQDVADYLLPLTSQDLRQRIEATELTTTQTTVQELSPLVIDLFEAITVGNLERVEQFINTRADVMK